MPQSSASDDRTHRSSRQSPTSSDRPRKTSQSEHQPHPVTHEPQPSPKPPIRSAAPADDDQATNHENPRCIRGCIHACDRQNVASQSLRRTWVTELGPKLQILPLLGRAPPIHSQAPRGGNGGPRAEHATQPAGRTRAEPQSATRRTSRPEANAETFGRLRVVAGTIALSRMLTGRIVLNEAGGNALRAHAVD